MTRAVGEAACPRIGEWVPPNARHDAHRRSASNPSGSGLFQCWKYYYLRRVLLGILHRPRETTNRPLPIWNGASPRNCHVLRSLCRARVLSCARWCSPLLQGYPIGKTIPLIDIENRDGTPSSVLFVAMAAFCCGNHRHTEKKAKLRRKERGYLHERPFQRSWYVSPLGIYPIMANNLLKPILGSIADRVSHCSTPRPALD